MISSKEFMSAFVQLNINQLVRAVKITANVIDRETVQFRAIVPRLALTRAFLRMAGSFLWLACRSLLDNSLNIQIGPKVLKLRNSKRRA